MAAIGRNKVFGSAFLLLFLIIAQCLPNMALSAQAAPAVKPKLVVLIVAQALTVSGINRFSDKFGTGGLRFLADAGANFVNCRFTSASAQSASGSATIVTGALPWAHGIISDQWFDRRKGKSISAVYDESAQMVGANASASTSKFLQGTTIGDQMKLATNGRSKVFSIGVTDTQTLLLGGRLANMALWFDSRTGSTATGSLLRTRSALLGQGLQRSASGRKIQRQALAETTG